MAGTAATVGANLPVVYEPSQAGKWLVAGWVMLGTFLSVTDATVVNVAMPHMMGSVGKDLLTITWVSTACGIAETIMVMPLLFLLSARGYVADSGHQTE
jgi:DHA2 family multidrug resistance protein